MAAALFFWYNPNETVLARGVIVDVDASGAMRLVRQRRGREIPVAGLTPDAASVAAARRVVGSAELVMRLGPGALLEREVTLPQAAEANLTEILRLDMDRLTPFSADEIVWTHAIVRRDPARAEITVRLSLLPWPPALAALTTLGMAPHAVIAPSDQGQLRVIKLHDRPSASGHIDRVALRAAAAILAVMIAAVIVTPILREARMMANAEATITSLRPAVAEAETLRRGLAAARDGAAALGRASAGGVRPLEVIATLTSALPDDTYLTELSLRTGAIEIRGQSRNAARLIGILSEEPRLDAVAFAAPVTKADTETVELFAIRAAVRP